MQNVFLAMALPWLVRTCIPPWGPSNFEMPSKGIIISVLCMLVTAAVLWFLVIVKDNFQPTKQTGIILIGVYVVYLAYAILSALM